MFPVRKVIERERISGAHKKIVNLIPAKRTSPGKILHCNHLAEIEAGLSINVVLVHRFAHRLKPCFSAKRLFTDYTSKLGLSLFFIRRHAELCASLDACCFSQLLFFYSNSFHYARGLFDRSINHGEFNVI